MINRAGKWSSFAFAAALVAGGGAQAGEQQELGAQVASVDQYPSFLKVTGYIKKSTFEHNCGIKLDSSDTGTAGRDVGLDGYSYVISGYGKALDRPLSLSKIDGTLVAVTVDATNDKNTLVMLFPPERDAVALTCSPPAKKDSYDTTGCQPYKGDLPMDLGNAVFYATAAQDICNKTVADISAKKGFDTSEEARANNVAAAKTLIPFRREYLAGLLARVATPK